MRKHSTIDDKYTNFIYYNYESVHDLSHITKNTHLLSLIDLDKDHIILTL